MKAGAPISEEVAAVMSDALSRYQKRLSALPPGPGKVLANDLELEAWPQTWPTTALGFNGIGGQAMTTAQTYVVSCYGVDPRCRLVYFAGRFAYAADVRTFDYNAAHQYRTLPSVREAGPLLLQEANERK